MVLDVDKEMLSVNRMLGNKKENFQVEGDVIVPDVKPDILNTICTSANIIIYKKEVMDGKIKIDGSINVYIMYLADSENSNVRGLNTSLDFSKVFDFPEARSNVMLEDVCAIKDIDCKVLNGRKINIKASIDFDLKIYSNNQVQIIKEIDKINDIQCLKRSVNIDSLAGQGCQKAYAKDTINVEDGTAISEILKSEIRIINKDIKLSYNKILAKADALVKVLYLTEDDEIKSCLANIPVMGFVDMDNLTDDMMCDMNYEIRNILMKINENNSIYVEIEFEISAKAYQNKTIDVIDDLYSPCRNIEFNSKQLTTSQNVASRKEAFSIKQSVNIPELENSTIYDMTSDISINNQNIIDQKIMIDGVARINIVYSTGNASKTDVKTIDMPFEFVSNVENVNNGMRINSDVELQDVDFIIMPNNNIDITVKTMFNVNIVDEIKMNIIDDINVVEEECKKNPSIIIYYVKKGDTLWSIAKRFNSTIECIAKFNELEDYEKNLKVGMQLFIPRYLSKNDNICA